MKPEPTKPFCQFVMLTCPSEPGVPACVSRPTPEKATAIVEAAEKEPERYGDLVERMDRQGGGDGRPLREPLSPLFWRREPLYLAPGGPWPGGAKAVSKNWRGKVAPPAPEKPVKPVRTGYGWTGGAEGDPAHSLY